MHKALVDKRTLTLLDLALDFAWRNEILIILISRRAEDLLGRQ